MTKFAAYKKWAQVTPFLQVGHVVLVIDDGLPSLHWKLGRIQETFKGRDGLVRSGLVKTSYGVLRRPITVLHLMEAADTLKADKHYRQKHCLFCFFFCRYFDLNACVWAVMF